MRIQASAGPSVLRPSDQWHLMGLQLPGANACICAPRDDLSRVKVPRQISLCRALPPAPQHFCGRISSVAHRSHGQEWWLEFLAGMEKEAHNLPARQVGHTENVGHTPQPGGHDPLSSPLSLCHCFRPWSPKQSLPPSRAISLNSAKPVYAILTLNKAISLIGVAR